jgi:hypothetical protein
MRTAGRQAIPCRRSTQNSSHAEKNVLADSLPLRRHSVPCIVSLKEDTMWYLRKMATSCGLPLLSRSCMASARAVGSSLGRAPAWLAMSVPTHTSTTGTHEQCMLAVCHIGCNAIRGWRRTQRQASKNGNGQPWHAIGTLCPPRASHAHTGMTGSDPCMHMDKEGVNPKSSKLISLGQASRWRAVVTLSLR